MVLIMSEKSDVSTVHIIEWLAYWNIPFLRLDEDEWFNLEIATLNNESEPEFKLYNKNKQFYLSEIKAFWYRRGQLNILPFIDKAIVNHKQINDRISTYLEKEQETLENYIHFLLNKNLI